MDSKHKKYKLINLYSQIKYAVDYIKVLVLHKNSSYFYNMVIKNIQAALKELLTQELMSVYEFAASTGLSPMGIKRILDGKTNRVQEGTLRKIRESADWDFNIVEDKIHFFKKRKEDEASEPQPAEEKKKTFLMINLAEANAELLREIAEGFEKLTPEEIQEIRNKVQEIINRGKQ